MENNIINHVERIETFAVNDLLDYNTNKFNRKMIFQNEATNIVAFALKRGQRIPNQTVRNKSFLLVTEGELILSIGCSIFIIDFTPPLY